MKDVLSAKWFAISITLLIGIAIGLIVIKPLLRKLAKAAKKKELHYLFQFLNTLKKISTVLGAVLLLNFIGFYPLEIELKGTYDKVLGTLDTVIICFLFGEFFVFIYDKYSNQNSDNKVSSIFHMIIRLLVYSVGIFVISGILEYDIKTLLAALGVGGLAVALALQDTLGNMFAGMQMLVSKQLKPGDYIKMENDVEGYVLDINWRNTTIRTLSENIVIVPNTKISSTVTTNYFTIQKNMYFQIAVGVHYDSDLEKVEKVTLEVAEEVLSQYPHIPNYFKPRVRFYEFADSSINFKVWLAADLYENQNLIRHHFIKALQARYNKEGINIPFPIRTLYMEK